MVPANLDEYMEKMLELRDQIKAQKNEFKSSVAADLKDIDKIQLMEFGMNEARADAEVLRLAAAGQVWTKLKAFDDLSS